MQRTYPQTARLVLLMGCSLLIAGSLTGADGVRPSVVPDEDYPKFVEQQVKILQDALQALPDKTGKDKTAWTEKAQCAAVMIAAIAQDDLSGKQADQRATLRDAALEIASLIHAQQQSAAQAKAKLLPNLPANPNAKKVRLPLYGKHFDLNELMSQYKMPTSGGQGLEKLLFRLQVAKNRSIAASEMKDTLRLAAYQNMLIAEMTAEHQPGKDAKVWLELSLEMHQGARELATVLQAPEKDGKAAFAALNKLTATCSSCHDKFRAR